MAEDKGNHIRRIKAPYVDNSALIKENALTLIGRVTNPQEQRIWALLPSLPRKWHLQGRITCSDLGNGCFQFRFEKEEDLKRVLDNRPYHFAYWMVIIQRWEPIISASFPSQIPFWIRIKGLPLHFWIDEMVCNIGKDLGTLLGHELTKSTARVKVLLDGLKPLVKEAIVEYDSGEESIISLEYEKLENHCSKCGSLSHLREDCPAYLREKHQDIESNGHQLQTQEKTPKLEHNASYRSSRQTTSDLLYRDTTYQQEGKPIAGKASTQQEPFQERVDRHGNSFGPRVGALQPRAPPAVKREQRPRADSSNWRCNPQSAVPETQAYNSPPYTTERAPIREGRLQRNHPFPQRGMSEWREKPSLTRSISHNEDANVGTSLPPAQQTMKTQGRQLTVVTEGEDHLIQELHRATNMYLSCSDPTEATARRLRVMASDKRGQTEVAAAGFMSNEGTASFQSGSSAQIQSPIRP